MFPKSVQWSSRITDSSWSFRFPRHYLSKKVADAKDINVKVVCSLVIFILFAAKLKKIASFVFIPIMERAGWQIRGAGFFCTELRSPVRRKKLKKFNIFRKLGVCSDNPNPQRRLHLEFELFWLARKKVFIGQTCVRTNIFKWLLATSCFGI